MSWPANVAWPLSSWLCDKAADVSAWAYRRTGTGHDRSDGHRTLTHTVLAGLAAGALAGLFAALAPHGPAILVGVLVAFAAQAVLPATTVRPIERWRRRVHVRGPWLVARLVRRVGRLARRAKRAAAVWPLGLVAGCALEVYQTGGWWLGLMVAAGWLTHLAGDACTEQGVPLLWPLRVRRQRWRMVGLWQPLRIYKGGTAKRVHLAAAVVLAMAGSGWLIIVV